MFPWQGVTARLPIEASLQKWISRRLAGSTFEATVTLYCFLASSFFLIHLQTQDLEKYDAA